MTPPPSVFHALLRPAVLQILRAAGYQGARAGALDALTDLAVRYFFRLCQVTAIHAAQNGSPGAGPGIVDIRMALQHVGALLPEAVLEEQEFMGIEDMRGTEEFLAWAQGAANREIKRVALDGSDEALDWLDALKKKHSKTDEDTKYLGTLLGNAIEHGDVVVEGGEHPSITTWEVKMKTAAQRTSELMDREKREPSETPSSGLSSLGDRTIEDVMDLA